jgi:membrane protease YdiL (CAAX protease family)
MIGTQLVPAFRQWPWAWLVPMVAYVLVVIGVPRLRCPMVWLRTGRLSTSTVGLTVIFMVLTPAVLFGFAIWARPDVSGFRGALPVEALGGPLFAGVIFTVVNATLEELVFRGVLFDALEPQRGTAFALVATSVLFGLGHWRGFPAGLLGASLATLFGFVTGGLRWWTGGLALPILVHMAADATIYTIILRSGGLS